MVAVLIIVALYIKKTINELLENIPNLELIIVDDNSTDGTQKIIHELNHNNKFKIIVRKTLTLLKGIGNIVVQFKFGV